MDLRTIADLIISAILLGALGAGSRGLWVFGKAHEQAIATLRETCAREIASLKEAHGRELTARDREIEARDRRLEAANVTEARLIEMALRSTVAGEKTATAAEKLATKGPV